MNKLPRRALTNIDLLTFAKSFNIPHFRGVFMRDDLPKRVRKYERGIVNLDSINGPGTHWIAYKKIDRKVLYFDSFGNLRPPAELIKYFNSNGSCIILYNYNIYQSFNTSNCGHLCLKFLTE